MKREHPIPRKLSDNNTISSATTPGGGACSGSSSAGGGGATSNNYYMAEAANGKSKLWEKAEKDAAVDELLAVLGYKVPSSAMVDVAHKLERLDQAMGHVQEDDLSHFASETVHYNPSDLSSWLEYMISELNPLPSNFDSFYSTFEDPFFKPTATDSSTVTTIDNSHNLQQQRQNHNPSALIFQDFSSDYNLKAIPGKAIYPQNQPSVPPLKRLKSSPGTQSASSTTQQVGATRLQDESTRPVVLVDSQENGIRLVHMLMACAEAIQQENLELANALVKHIGILAVSQAGAMRKVATYFAKALAQRIYRIYPQNPQVSAFSDLLQMHFYETCPYMKFAHFTANQAILEAFANAKRVHVIDLGIKQGMQWPALLQALALRTDCPPSFRLTGIGPPSRDNTDHLQEVGLRLAQLAETIHVEFEYRGFVTNSLADLEASMLDLRENEVVAVNSVFELHQLLARPGAIEKVFSVVREMKPMIFTVVEQEANHNGPVFLDRFTESLHYYSTLFDSLEGCCGGGDAAATTVSNQYKVMSEEYLGRQIYNLVACEGVDRIERHESLNQWRNRFSSAGLEPVHLGSNAFKQAGMLLALFAGGDGYKVEENNGCLMLGWHTRPLIATSAWKLK